MDDVDGPPRWALIAALVLSIGAVITVLVLAANRDTAPSPVAIAAVPAPQATDPSCQALLAELPQQLGDFSRASLAEPAPDGVAAWRATDSAAAAGSAETVVLRCGLARPDEFVTGSPIQVVDAVQWFAVRGDGRATWFAVDRPVYVALTLPAGSGPTPIQELSDLIAQTMAATPIDPAPVG